MLTHSYKKKNKVSTHSHSRVVITGIIKRASGPRDVPAVVNQLISRGIAIYKFEFEFFGVLYYIFLNSPFSEVQPLKNSHENIRWDPPDKVAHGLERCFGVERP